MHSYLNSCSFIFLLFFTLIFIFSNSYSVFAIKSDDYNYNEEYDYGITEDDQNLTQLTTRRSNKNLNENTIGKNDSLGTNTLDKSNTQVINDKKLENFDFKSLTKIKLISDTIFKASQKVSNFSDNVKLNIRAFIDESSQGLSHELIQKLQQTLIDFIKSLELSKECLESFVDMKNGILRGELWPLKC